MDVTNRMNFYAEMFDVIVKVKVRVCSVTFRL